jgi:ABC-type branched-subunit amino acid transport system ATPase component
MFKISNATGGYGKTTIIRDVNVDVKRAEIVALLGRNGAGKTTIMRFATAQLNNAQGHVEIDGTRCGASSAERSRAGLGYVPQGRFVFPRMSVLENIAVAATAHHHDQAAAIDEAMHDFPVLKQKANDLAGSLSGGQQQILSLARALATKPKVLLLDEPTEGVQPSIIDEMSGILKRINKERQLAILVAEQNLDFCLSLASRGYVIEKGRVRLEADHERLKTDTDLHTELLGV